MPEGPWLYPEDQIADVALRLIAAEITREKLTLRLHQELPYELTVETEGWEERKDGSVKIDQIVYVARDGHKGIALGPKGETIKAVGQAARTGAEGVPRARGAPVPDGEGAARAGSTSASATGRWGSTSRRGSG